MAAVAEGEIAKGKAGIGQGTAFGKTERTQSIDDAIYSVTLVIDFCYVITFSPMIKRIKTGAGLLSRNQKLVLSVVIASPVPLSAYAILKALQEEGVRHPLPVYRALHKLVVLGLVHRLHNAFC